MKVAYDKSIKKWMVEGAQYFIEGSKNKVIVVKILDKKVIPLTQSDIRACEDSGWKVQGVEDDSE